MGPLRGRFAPSPSGPLHIGSMLTAVASYLDAKCRSAEWWVRIEDLDQSRSRAQYAKQHLQVLELFGLHWDGTVLYQSQRLSIYLEVLAELKNNGLLYSCECSRHQIQSQQLTASANADMTIYPGTCRHKEINGEPVAWRLLVQGTETVHDRLQEPLQQNLATEAGDFIVRRKDGSASYDLAVVVDDALTGVTDIVRGVDIWPLTPRQQYLRRLLGYPSPTTLHLPLVTERGQKLSKTNNAIGVDVARAPTVLSHILGYLAIPLPEALVAAPVMEQLAFAQSEWNPNLLKGIQNIDLANQPLQMKGNSAP